MREIVQQHYSRENLAQAIREALLRSGKTLHNITCADLASIDEFHIRGQSATRELAQNTGAAAGMHFLDVGCGIGGPARLLAAEFGCRVTGVDLTEEYVRAAKEITRWVGLEDSVEFQQGDATSLPFPGLSFDAAWTIHAAMNIPEKGRMYQEVKRVLKPGGRFAIFDIMRGAGGEPKYPMPWARDASLSFLATPEEMRRLLSEVGFKIVHWRDTSAIGIEWIQQMMQRGQQDGAPPLALNLLLGAEFPPMVQNVARGLIENGLVVGEFVCAAA